MILFLCAPAVLINLDKVCIKRIQKSLWSIVMNIFCWASAWACKEVSNRQSIHDRATWNCLALPQLLVILRRWILTREWRGLCSISADMIFIKNFTPADFPQFRNLPKKSRKITNLSIGNHQQVLMMLKSRSPGRQNLKCSVVECWSWYKQHQICGRFGGQCPVFGATRCGMPGLVGKDGTFFSCERPCWCCPGVIGKEVKFWLFLVPTRDGRGRFFFLWGGVGWGKGQNLWGWGGARQGSKSPGVLRGGMGRSSLVPTINCPDICIETLLQVPDCTSNVYSSWAAFLRCWTDLGCKEEEIRPLLGGSYPLPARSIPARKLQTWVGIVCTVQCTPPVLIILVHSVVIFYYCIKWSVWARCSLCIMWRETISSEMNKLGVMIKVIDDIS